MSAKLPLRLKILYGIGDTGNSLMVFSIGFFLLKFYTDAILIAPALAATALMIGKLWDAINDPVFGWFSDRVKSPLGRRSIFIISGAVPFGVASALLWFVPKTFTGIEAFFWITFMFMCWGTLWTITNVPYNALLSELTDDYDERASMIAFRMTFAISGYCLGAALTPAIIYHFPSQRQGYAVMGMIYGFICTAVLLICIQGIREKTVTYVKKPASLLSTFIAVTKNKPFMQLIIGYGFCNIAFALVKTLLVYLLTYQFHMEDKLSIVMLLMLLSAALFLFPWKVAAQRFEKGRAWAIGLMIGGGSIATVYFLPAHETPWIYLIAIVAGIGFSSNWVLPWAMVPDVVDYDQLKTGEHRSGAYFGLWGLIFKLSESLGIVITGWVLQLSHYVPNVEQTPQVLFTIRLFAGPIPALIFFLAIPLLFTYPITRKKHQEILKALK
jgi:GPH family glycoside/pentoside/hexuronide:cation symporter